MLIRELDGFYAGQVREFPSHIALGLIAAGRAENPFNEIEDTPEEREALEAARAAAAPAVPGKQAQSRRKGR
jgi:hypothetical protein